MSEGLQNLVERKLIGNGCGRAVSGFAVRSSNVTSVEVLNDKTYDDKTCLRTFRWVNKQSGTGDHASYFARMFVTAIGLGAVETGL